MPISVRRSSVGTSRRDQNKHIPYRADDFQHGKRTGIAVGYVDHMSDEFEPFEKVLSQADKRTPPKPKVKKKRAPKTPIVEEDDENGEMSMELEESTPNSPAMYFSNARVATITSSVQRVGSSSRPVNHSSDVDYDQVPSPRTLPRVSSAFSSRRQSMATVSGRSLGSSHLSRSTVAHDMEDDGGDFDDGGYDDPGPQTDYDNEPLPDSSPPRSLSRRRSFQQMDRDEEQEQDEVEEHVNGGTPTSAKARGKQRQANQSRDFEEQAQEMEDDIANGLADVELEPIQEEDEQEEEVPKRGTTRRRDANDSTEKEQRASKKARRENDGAAEKRPKRRTNGILAEVIEDPNVDNEDGLRRSQRTRYAPLDWWRLEKVVYGRRTEGKSVVPCIKEIRRVPKEVPQPLGKQKRRSKPRSKSKTVEIELDGNMVFNPEEGWDDQTEPLGVILDYENGNETEKRIAFTSNMVTPRAAANNDFYFQKIFGDNDFIAAGQLVIPPKKMKPTKSTKDNTFIFYVIEGAVNFKVHNTSFILTTGGMFLVPRGNMYFIQNISDRDAKLFFAQARKMPELLQDDMDSPPADDRPSSSRSPSKGRGSIGRASSEPKKPSSKGSVAGKRASSSRN